MSFVNMRFGVPRDSELMATMQECGNWGLALVPGQTTTLLNLSAEENTSTGWLGRRCESAHLFPFPKPWLSDWLSVWLDGLGLHYFLLEKVRLRVKLTVGLSVSWPHTLSDSHYKAQGDTLTSLWNRIATLILSASHTQLFSHRVLWPAGWMQHTQIHLAH